MLDNLSLSLQNVVKKIAGARRIDPRTIDEMVKDVQRALLQADVNVELVMGLSTRIRERSLKEKPAPGANPREHVIRIVYQELVDVIGKSTDVPLSKQTILMVGLYGGGKTTTVAKLARYFQRKGLKPAVICADSYRPGAYDQLKQLCEQINVPFYGEKDSDALTIVKHGLKELKGDVKIIDTAGRHALEADLIKEMKQIHKLAKPDQNLLVLDGAMGQLAGKHAKAFDDAIGITGVIITKLDGTAKGGGALSAISETNSSIAFIGTGETLDDLERFDPDRFISRLLGMGDIKSLIERAEESLAAEDLDVESMIRGRFTLKDMYRQLEAISKLGPLKQVMQMMPIGLGLEISDEAYQVTKDRLSRYKVIMDSMTDEEMRDPRIVGSSRIKRIALGSGTSLEDVRELLRYHKMMQNAMKGLRGGKFPMQKLMKRFKM
ncbi:MAG: signal recognition particle protein Srp54 [Methanocellales archaeon]|nr:signal recognition particle protein Srp54 [Methanocellales archaeon]